VINVDRIITGDCLEVMKEMDSKSVDLVLVDPPYFRVMKNEWDNQWKTLDDYIVWLSLIADEWRRILKDNGSLYCFADDKVAAYVQVMLDKKFLLLNSLVWYKPNSQPQKNTYSLRSYAPMTERILYYAAQDANNTTLREYFRQYQDAIGLNIKQINAIMGDRTAEHAFYWGSTQWELPTPEVYERLKEIPIKTDFVRCEYEFIHRPFNADGSTIDVLSYNLIGSNETTEHPTTKPLALIKRLLTVATKPDALVLDCFLGSGTTAVACVQTGRHYIGIEQSPEYVAIAERRIKSAVEQIGMGL